MLRSQALKLPVGDVPDWELNGSDSESPDLKTPAESLVILQSLKQSRDKWLRGMFPKFSSRGRGGKQPDVVPPPHTIHNRGRCTLQIGPHFFMDTTVFEVHYNRPPIVTISHPTAFVYQSVPRNPSSQVQPQTSSTSSSASTGESNTLLSSISSTLSTLPPGLISQVNTAAATNPTLANLLQLAVSGRATPDQLRALGLLIQPLTTSFTTSVSTTATTTTTSQPTATATDSSCTPFPTTMTTTAPQYQYQALFKEFDIVIEFRDTPSDRWLFPRGPATCDFVSTLKDSASFGDLTVSTIIPFPGMTPPQEPSMSETGTATETPPKQVVEFHFKMASSYIWDTFTRWVGSKEKMEENRKSLSEIEPPQQQYLAYRLPEGSQLTQIQNAALSSYSMKLIKPSSESGRPKRRPAPRKAAQDLPGSPALKRKRQMQPKSQVPPPKIACFTCGQANVPLIMGGRYCRPCVESGRTGEASQAATGTGTSPSTHEDSQSVSKPTETLPGAQQEGLKD